MAGIAVVTGFVPFRAIRTSTACYESRRNRSQGTKWRHQRLSGDVPSGGWKRPDGTPAPRAAWRQRLSVAAWQKRDVAAARHLEGRERLEQEVFSGLQARHPAARIVRGLEHGVDRPIVGPQDVEQAEAFRDRGSPEVVRPSPLRFAAAQKVPEQGGAI